MLGQLDNCKIASADGALNVVEAHPDRVVSVAAAAPAAVASAASIAAETAATIYSVDS